jgi:hypothetical protein
MTGAVLTAVGFCVYGFLFCAFCLQLGSPVPDTYFHNRTNIFGNFPLFKHLITLIPLGTILGFQALPFSKWPVFY